MFQIINKSVKVCKDTTNTSYTWGCCHMVTNHTIYDINRYKKQSETISNESEK